MMLEKAQALLPGFEGPDKRKEGLSVLVHRGLAQVATAQKNYAEARSQLDTWLKIQPESAAALSMLAGVAFMEKKPDEALAKLQEAAKLDANLLTPEALMAKWYESEGDRENATKYMITALNKNGKDVKTRLAAAQWAFEIKAFDEAMKQAAAARKLDPDSLEAKVISGNIAIFQKDYPTAEKFLEAAHLQSPANFAASNNLALALVEQGDDAKKQRALEYAQINARLYQKQAEPFSTLGWIFYQMGKVDEAERALRAAAGNSRRLSPDTAYYIARVSADRGRKDEAIQLLERATKTEGLFTKREEAEALLQQLKQQ